MATMSNQVTWDYWDFACRPISGYAHSQNSLDSILSEKENEELAHLSFRETWKNRSSQLAKFFSSGPSNRLLWIDIILDSHTSWEFSYHWFIKIWQGFKSLSFRVFIVFFILIYRIYPFTVIFVPNSESEGHFVSSLMTIVEVLWLVVQAVVSDVAVSEVFDLVLAVFVSVVLNYAAVVDSDIFVDFLEKGYVLSSSFTIDISALPFPCHWSWCYFGRKSIREKLASLWQPGVNSFFILVWDWVWARVWEKMKESRALDHDLVLVVPVMLAAMRLHISMFQGRKRSSVLQVHI